jgi:hypothetical protein
MWGGHSCPLLRAAKAVYVIHFSHVHRLKHRIDP